LHGRLAFIFINHWPHSNEALATSSSDKSDGGPKASVAWSSLLASLVSRG
jgi:hypothetical protein